MQAGAIDDMTRFNRACFGFENRVARSIDGAKQCTVKTYFTTRQPHFVCKGRRYLAKINDPRIRRP